MPSGDDYEDLTNNKDGRQESEDVSEGVWHREECYFWLSRVHILFPSSKRFLEGLWQWAYFSI